MSSQHQDPQLATMNDPWLTLAEIARYTKRSKSLISKHIRSGALRGVAPGEGRERRHWLSRRSWIDAWLENC